jgi:hypothetical protein
MFLKEREKMSNAADGETDIAVILTEGIVKDIVAGNQSKIVQVYGIALNMGYSRGSQFKYKTVSDLEDTKVAISRQGSGSQLMAYVNAHNRLENRYPSV